MQIGWIDFSDTDRKKALGVMTMMNEQGAVDEIGIGRIRDAFANIFFPGTSTIMTRAKYFFIVPYAFQDAIANKKLINYRQVIKEVEDNIERDCAEKMIKKCPGRGSGIIGSVSLQSHKWVSRKPSSIYWNGLRTLGIFTYENISTIESYVKIAFANRDNILTKNKVKKDDGDEDDDDSDAYHRKMKPFWNLPEGGYNHWRRDIAIELTFNEAQFLRQQISTHYQDTLFKAILDNNLPIKNNIFVGDIDNSILNLVSPRNQHLITLAKKFNVLVALLRLRYNKILTRGLNQDIIDRWEQLQNDTDLIADLDIKTMMTELKVWDTSTRIFLETSKQLLLENRIDELDHLIIKREQLLKGQRSKLTRASEYDPNQTIADYWLDYRLSSAIRIINDIFDAEKQNGEDNI
ncbi:MAG: hypothetical protein IKQ70_14840 [Bacteroidales bacterium]|nr:hypothetical protein [Bacteroidales bacterium]